MKIKGAIISAVYSPRPEGLTNVTGSEETILSMWYGFTTIVTTSPLGRTRIYRIPGKITIEDL